MRIHLNIEGAPRRAVTPHSEFGAVAGACPLCAAEPFCIQGRGMHTEDDRRYVAEGYCAACNGHVGRIVAEPDTLFGIREDEAVLNGRCRVY